MYKQQQEELIALTEECLACFWQRDPEFVIQYFADDIVWIGSQENEFIEGSEASADDLRTTTKELKPCHLSQASFSVTFHNREICAVVSRYLVSTDEEVGYHLQTVQRCTFIWSVAEDVPQLHHIHVSNPIGEMKVTDEERFPNTLGKLSKRHWQESLEAYKDQSRIVISDVKDKVHFLRCNEILYISSYRRYCLVHTTDGASIQIRVPMKDFLASVNDTFTDIHRCYIINNTYLKSIQPYEVTLVDGTKLPVPVKRYTEVKKRILASYQDEEPGMVLNKAGE